METGVFFVQKVHFLLIIYYYTIIWNYNLETTCKILQLLQYRTRIYRLQHYFSNRFGKKILTFYYSVFSKGSLIEIACNYGQDNDLSSISRKQDIFEAYEIGLLVIQIFFELLSSMGLFGNKDTKSSKDLDISKELPVLVTKPIESAFNPHINAQFTPSKNIFQEFSQNYHAACDSVKKKWNQWMDTPQMRDAKKWRIRLTEDYYKPLNRVYRSLPERLTQFKIQNFGTYEFKERLFGLEALTLLVAICTFNHKRAQFLPINRLLFATRNSALTYLLGGLLVAPEIYNPFLKRDL